MSNPFDCIIPQVFSILCLLISQWLCYLNSSFSVILSQIVMCFMSFFPFPFVSNCLISWLDLFCVPQPLILDFVFRSLLTRCFWTLLCFSTFNFGFSLCFIVLSGLPFGLEPPPVTSFLIWVTSVDSVSWNTDPVSGLSLCLWCRSRTSRL